MKVINRLINKDNVLIVAQDDEEHAELRIVAIHPNYVPEFLK